MVFFYHVPTRNDEFLSDPVVQVASHFQNVVAAREGWVATILRESNCPTARNPTEGHNP